MPCHALMDITVSTVIATPVGRPKPSLRRRGAAKERNVFKKSGCSTEPVGARFRFKGAADKEDTSAR